MSVDGFTSAVDRFRVALERLKESRAILDDCESLELGDPFIDDVWDTYLSSRIDAENAITDLAQELAGLSVVTRIANVCAEEDE